MGGWGEQDLISGQKGMVATIKIEPSISNRVSMG